MKKVKKKRSKMTFWGFNSPVSLEFNSQSIKWGIKLLFSWGGEMIQFINIHISARKLHNPSIFSANNILQIYYTFYTLTHLKTLIYSFWDRKIGWMDFKDLVCSTLSGSVLVRSEGYYLNCWAEKLMKLWHLAQG